MPDQPSERGADVLGPGAVVGFVGIGNMGLPMARRLAEAGYAVRGHDVDPDALERLSAIPGATVADSVADAADGAVAVVLMLPSSAVVDAVVFGGRLLERLAPGTVLIDMGSSEPGRTRELAAAAAGHGVEVVDAPVSGGVKGAEKGTLTIMVGGDPGPVAAVRPLLEVLGRKVPHVGPAAAGHALKALNNLMSAAHLLATSEALLAGRAFGLDYEVMLDAVNGSSGRSVSTERKWPDHIVGRTFDSGFDLRLMLKDMRTAVGLAASVGMPSRLGEAAVDLWARAAEHLPPDADHTEIARWLEESAQAAPGAGAPADPEGR